MNEITRQSGKTSGDRRRRTWFALLAVAVGSVAMAGTEDIDFGPGCTKALPTHTSSATVGTSLSRSIHIVNGHGQNVFWGFIGVPHEIATARRCLEEKPLTAFNCNGIRIRLPSVTPDKAVPETAAATIEGIPLAPGTFRFRLQLAPEGGSAVSCEREYRLIIGVANPDTKAPTAPGALKARAIVPNPHIEVGLSWEASIDDHGVGVYVIERCDGADCSNFLEVARRTGKSTIFRDRGVEEITTYRYRVRAIDAAGNVGPASGIATVTTDSLNLGPTPR